MVCFVLSFNPVKLIFTSRSNTVVASLLSSSVLWLLGLHRLSLSSTVSLSHCLYLQLSPSLTVSIFHCLYLSLLLSFTVCHCPYLSLSLFFTVSICHSTVISLELQTNQPRDVTGYSTSRWRRPCHERYNGASFFFYMFTFFMFVI